MTDDLPTAVQEPAFDLGGVTIRCYVLSDGQRLLNADDVEKFMGLLSATDWHPDQEAFADMLEWSRGHGR